MMCMFMNYGLLELHVVTIVSVVLLEGQAPSLRQREVCNCYRTLFLFLLSSQVSLVSHSGTVCKGNFNQSGFHVFGERTRW